MVNRPCKEVYHNHTEKMKTNVLIDFQCVVCYLGTIETQYGTRQHRKEDTVVRITSYISPEDVAAWETLKAHLGAQDNSAAVRHLIAKGVERMAKGDTKEQAISRLEVMLTGMAHDLSVANERIAMLMTQAARTQAAVQMVLYLDYSKMAEPVVLQAGQVDQIKEVIRQLTA